MPFCGQCGAPVSERSKYCVSCGEKLEAMPIYGSAVTSSPSAIATGSVANVDARSIPSAPSTHSPSGEDGINLGRIFSPKGRVGRKDFWLVLFLVTIVWIVAAVLYTNVFHDGICPAGIAAYPRFGNQNCVTDEDAQGVGGLLFLVWQIPMFFMAVKRAHDLDRTGLRMVVYAFVPILGLVQAIELLFDKGDLRQSSNRFGERNSGSPFPLFHRS